MDVEVLDTPTEVWTPGWGGAEAEAALSPDRGRHITAAKHEMRRSLRFMVR